MRKETLSNVQLGLFVLAGTAFLVAALYLIGNNRDLFNKTFQIKATFYKVNGLMKGNSVRFAGIDVGTVKRVEIISDSTVNVTLGIESDAKRFIRKNALATVGTDGLMGDKLVNITNTSEPAEVVKNGDVLGTLKPIETDQMLRTLDQTNGDLSVIASDLRKITQKVNSSNTLWSILMDTSVAENVKQAIIDLRATTQNTRQFTKDLSSVSQDMRNGKGLLGYLVRDTISANQLRSGIAKINEAGEKVSSVAADLKDVSLKLKKGEGPAGILLSDTIFAHDLSKSMRNIREGSQKLNENMEAMKHNFLFSGYFKKQEKENRKKSKDASAKQLSH